MPRLRNIEVVVQSVHNGRVHPVFSQTRTDYCRLSCVKPRMLDSDNIDKLRFCLPESFRQYCPDARRALGILAHEAADNVLLADLLAGEGSCCFESIPPLNDGDHFQLLLSLVTGIADRQLCRLFLLDRNAIAAIHQPRVEAPNRERNSDAIRAGPAPSARPPSLCTQGAQLWSSVSCCRPRLMMMATWVAARPEQSRIQIERTRHWFAVQSGCTNLGLSFLWPSETKTDDDGQFACSQAGTKAECQIDRGSPFHRQHHRRT